MIKYSRFATRLWQARTRKGYTQEELGRAIGKTQLQMSYFECDRGQPNHREMHALADILQVSVEWLKGYNSTDVLIVRHRVANAQHDVLDLETLVWGLRQALTPDELKQLKDKLS